MLSLLFHQATSLSKRGRLAAIAAVFVARQGSRTRAASGRGSLPKSIGGRRPFSDDRLNQTIMSGDP
jgi:hypothetical protein